VAYPTSYQAVDERARLLIATGRISQADAALDAFHPSDPPVGTLALDAQKVLMTRAEIALARGDAETAARLSAQARQEISRSNARDYLKGLEARAALVEGQAELLRSRPSEALAPLQRAVELRQSIMAPNSPSLAEAKIALANCDLDLGESEKALALSVEAKKALSSHSQLSDQYAKSLQILEKRLR
jgi:tetratricopeptide (TPR) repeat protein